MKEDAPPDGRMNFPATRWSLVLATKDDGGALAALTWLGERYWFPLFAYVRRRGHSPEDSEDLVQGFFAWLLGDDVVARAEAERGKFRSFLLGCMNNYLAGEWERAQRMKRGGGATFLSLHDEDIEARFQRELATPGEPEGDYDRLWAITLLDRALVRVRAECEADGNAGRFEVLLPFLQGARGEVPLADAAAKLGLTLPAVKSVVHRLRGRFRETIREEVRETVSSDAEIQEELRHLFAAIGR